MRSRSVWAGLAAPLIALALSAPPAPVRADGLAGSYLAARAAELRGDIAAAALHYARAASHDPESALLLERAMLYAVASGDVPAALPFAGRLEALQPDNRNLPLIFAVEEIRAGAFPNALARLDRSGEAMGPLVAGLLRGWCLSVDDLAAASAAFDAIGTSGQIGRLAGYHKGLAHAAAGDLETAARLLEAGEDDILAGDRRALLARAEVLAATGRQKVALDMLDIALARGVRDLAVTGLRDRIAAGEAVGFTRVPDATAGVAEALFGFGLIAGTGEGSRDLAIYVTRLALHLRPDLEDARLLVAELLEEQEQHDLALAALAAVPSESALHLRAESARASILSGSGREAEARVVLEALVGQFPAELGPITALADLHRRAERWGEAAAAYTRALALIPSVERRHWVFFYQRGIANERGGNWDAAEADFRRALELDPDQPLVLNYLGYSLVELGRNLAEAEDMIRRAVDARPDDGYIIDSLAWVLFRLGRFEEAVEPMERAVALVPHDPILNDHLGDILWMVGRRLEARFQWKRALSFDPEEKDEARIRRKLEIGLDAVLAEEASGKPAGDGG